jgi:hypothetical protein
MFKSAKRPPYSLSRIPIPILPNLKLQHTEAFKLECILRINANFSTPPTDPDPTKEDRVPPSVKPSLSDTETVGLQFCTHR